VNRLAHNPDWQQGHWMVHTKSTNCVGSLHPAHLPHPCGYSQSSQQFFGVFLGIVTASRSHKGNGEGSERRNASAHTQHWHLLWHMRDHIEEASPNGGANRMAGISQGFGAGGILQAVLCNEAATLKSALVDVSAWAEIGVVVIVEIQGNAHI